MPDSDEPGIIHFTFAAPERIRSFGCGSLLVYCLNRCLFFCSFGREGAACRCQGSSDFAYNGRSIGDFALATFAVVLAPCSFGLGRCLTLNVVALGVDLDVLAILGSELATFGGLLDREADTATCEIEIDDLDPTTLRPA